MNKKELRKFSCNFEIDSVIGKRNDKYALLTMIDIHNGNFYMRKYDRTSAGFALDLGDIINNNSLKIKTITMDNGGENNKLHIIVSKEKLYNCAMQFWTKRNTWK